MTINAAVETTQARHPILSNGYGSIQIDGFSGLIPKKCFCIMADGHRYQEHGISTGSVLFCQRAAEINDGDLIVVKENGAFALYLYLKDRKVKADGKSASSTISPRPMPKFLAPSTFTIKEAWQKGQIMSKFQNYLKTFDITSTLTEEDIDKTLALLQIYGPAVRRTASRIGEMEEECYEGRRQSISDFINLAIDYDRDTDRKRIADRLAEMGHSMQLLSVMEDALVLVKDTPPNGGTYFNILQARYFDVYCTSNEEAYLNLGISSSTYYRHIKPAIRAYAASLWCVVIPDLIIREHLQQSGSVTAQVEVS